MSGNTVCETLSGETFFVEIFCGETFCSYTRNNKFFQCFTILHGVQGCNARIVNCSCVHLHIELNIVIFKPRS